MFSATAPRGIAKLAQTHQKDNAERLVIGNTKTQHADITYRALAVAQHDAENAIINVLRYYDAPNAIVFASESPVSRGDPALVTVQAVPS